MRQYHSHLTLIGSDPSSLPRLAEPTDLLTDTRFSDGLFFNSPDFLALQPQPVYQLNWVDTITRQTAIRCAFGVQSGLALSPVAAPFGSVEWAVQVTPAELSQFVAELLQQAQQAGANQLRLTHPPACYAPSQAHELFDILTQHGFSSSRQVATFHIPVCGQPLEYRMRASERQRFRKCVRTGFRALQWESPQIDELIRFITEHRRLKGYPLSVSEDQLAHLLSRFPENFPVFGVWSGRTLVATCVCVRVRANSLYTFIPVSHTDYATFSPMVMLLESAYEYCQQTGIDLLDLGPALDPIGQFKPSLARFKENMGAMCSPRFTFEISL
ncbi:GNAT family N-acetyltransferase [Rudanella paleaurantiibacter]|uniref:GNAT family N-acetyltransferase n=1 Tax=Rudanella paleaurantiibacter TaxID=2614655 RepID=A0A7J5TSN9_9BACT|nr:GNAT family N-acetyltransferase [Rudanella paleaurantiibacter]KAB7726151.1 GNAT family N-acetyltransferase [Rudanella paleaurantiibacter]